MKSGPIRLKGPGSWPGESLSLSLDSTVQEGWCVDEEPGRPVSRLSVVLLLIYRTFRLHTSSLSHQLTFQRTLPKSAGRLLIRSIQAW